MQPEMNPKGRDIKLRCPYCDSTFSSKEQLREHVVHVHGSDPPPRPYEKIRLLVNGHEHILDVGPSWTLHYVLHDQLGYIGTKTLCDRGVCSSCTVILEDRPVLSCMTLAIECDGMIITTIEGIASEEHPLIESYISQNAMQCGYCTPGFVVTAKALLDRMPNPSLDDIEDAIEGNLCRCGTYPQHSKAIMEAAHILLKNQAD